MKNSIVLTITITFVGNYQLVWYKAGKYFLSSVFIFFRNKYCIENFGPYEFSCNV